MIIGFDAKRIFCNRSGLGNYGRAIVKNIARLYPHYTLHLFTPRILLKVENAELIESNNVFIHEFKWMGTLKRSILLPIIAKKYKLDAFHGLSGELPLISFSKNVNTVVTIHDIIYVTHPEYYGFFDRYMYKLKCSWTLNNTNNIIYISRSTKKEVVDRYRHIQAVKDTILHPILDQSYDLFQTEISESTFRQQFGISSSYWLYVGSTGPRKNVKSIIKAMSILPNNKLNHLIIISRNIDQSLQSYIENLNLSPYVSFQSEVDDFYLKYFYKYAELLIYPSFIEGFGLPILEALKMNTPVLCSNIAPHKEVGGNLVTYFDPNDPNELANKLVIQQTRLNQDMSKHLTNFDIQHNIGKLIDIYKNMV